GQGTEGLTGIGGAPYPARLGAPAVAGDVKAVGMVGHIGSGREVDRREPGNLGPGRAAVVGKEGADVGADDDRAARTGGSPRRRGADHRAGAEGLDVAP